MQDPRILGMAHKTKTHSVTETPHVNRSMSSELNSPPRLAAAAHTRPLRDLGRLRRGWPSLGCDATLRGAGDHDGALARDWRLGHPVLDGKQRAFVLRLGLAGCLQPTLARTARGLLFVQRVPGVYVTSLHSLALLAIQLPRRHERVEAILAWPLHHRRAENSAALAEVQVNCHVCFLSYAFDQG